MSDAEFIRALKSGEIDTIRQVPKTDLHNHACLGYRLAWLSDHLGKPIPDAPGRMPDFESFVAYLQAYLHPYIYTREGFEFSINAALREAQEDGITHLEMSIDAQMFAVYETPVALGSFLTAMNEAYPGIVFRPEIGINREWEVGTVDKWVVPLIESGYFYSVDLYGNEKFGEPEVYAPYFRQAKSHGLVCKAHAGEFRDAEFVRRSAEILDLDEIQHGIAAAESPEVMRWIAEKEITLHLCPTSNVRLSRVEEMSVHPIRILYDAGVPVTINSDDIMIFGATVTDEYLALHRHNVMTAEELNQIRLHGLRIRGHMES